MKFILITITIIIMMSGCTRYITTKSIKTCQESCKLNGGLKSMHSFLSGWTRLQCYCMNGASFELEEGK